VQLREVLSNEIDNKLWRNKSRDKEDALIRCLGLGEGEDMCKGHVTDINLQMSALAEREMVGGYTK
jgi:hypothetical protein